MRLNRRGFLAAASLSACGVCLRSRSVWAQEEPAYDLPAIFGTDYPTGVAMCVVRGGEVTFLGGHGWADREARVPMTSDTLMNIASVSKTITATAVMQLVEDGRLDLDAPIDDHLPIKVRNPHHLDTAITCRQLLAHRSSLADGPSYEISYTCGDAEPTLADWLADYLQPDGEHYDAQKNFHPWAPGTADPPDEPRPYSNVGYGLLAHVLERVSGQSFPEFTRERIFEPLAMNSSAWHLANIDLSRHAIPYSRKGTDFGFPPHCPDPESFLPQAGYLATDASDDLRPHCLYGHPTYPDGFLRSSAADLARFLLALTGGGATGGNRILATSTLQTMLSNDHFGRALCWNATTLGGRSSTVWYHNGSDPGVMTMLGFCPEDGTGVAVITNCGDPGPGMGRALRGVLLDEN